MNCHMYFDYKRRDIVFSVIFVNRTSYLALCKLQTVQTLFVKADIFDGFLFTLNY